MIIISFESMHHGELIQRIIKEKNYSIAALAKQMHRSRPWVYALFEKNNLPVELLVELGKILKYDFSTEIGSIKKKNIYQSIASESEQPYTQLKPNQDSWKERYYLLLENYSKLNEKYILLLESKGKRK